MGRTPRSTWADTSGLAFAVARATDRAPTIAATMPMAAASASTPGLKNSVAFATGANRGLGLAFAKELVARGASKVYAGVRNPEGINIPELATRCAMRCQLGSGIPQPPHSSRNRC